MGNVHAHRGRLTGITLVAVAVLAALLALAAGAQQASAFAEYQHGNTNCGSCHTGSVSNAQCITCHTGYAAPTASHECWSCHTPGQDVQVIKTTAPTSCTDTCHLADGTTHTHNPHPDRGGCAAAGCHTVTTDATTANGSPHHVVKTVVPVTTTMTLKALPSIQRLGRSVKFSGAAGSLPALAGAKVALKVERKVGTRWVKMKSTTKLVNATTGAFSWTYKTVKRGPHRVTASIAKTSTFTAKKLVRSFRVR